MPPVSSRTPTVSSSEGSGRFPAGSRRMPLKVIVPTNRAEWRCWSGFRFFLASLNGICQEDLPPFSELACSFFLPGRLDEGAPLCWSSRDPTCSVKSARSEHDDLDGFLAKKLSQPIGPEWHCWSGLRHVLSRMPTPSKGHLMGFFQKVSKPSSASGAVGQVFRSWCNRRSPR